MFLVQKKWLPKKHTKFRTPGSPPPYSGLVLKINFLWLPQANSCLTFFIHGFESYNNSNWLVEMLEGYWCCVMFIDFSEHKGEERFCHRLYISLVLRSKTSDEISMEPYTWYHQKVLKNSKLFLRILLKFAFKFHIIARQIIKSFY